MLLLSELWKKWRIEGLDRNTGVREQGTGNREQGTTNERATTEILAAPE